MRGYQLCVKHANDKGGVLGRRIELLVEDDQSKAEAAVALYEKLITQDQVDAILGPHSSTITEAVANVSEKRRMPMLAPFASTPSIFKKGRRFVFMVQTPAEAFFEGLADTAAKRGLKTIAVINEDTLFPQSGGAGHGRARPETWPAGGPRRGLSKGPHRFRLDPGQDQGAQS